MLKRTLSVLVSMVLVLLLAACAGNGFMKDSSSQSDGVGSLVDGAGSNALLGLLTNQLGVSSEQALGGAGAIFSSAQENMSADDFGSLADVVPGFDEMLGAAPKTEPGDDMLGSAFKALGMETDMVRSFMPIVLGYVEGTGGSALMQSLQAALM